MNNIKSSQSLPGINGDSSQTSNPPSNISQGIETNLKTPPSPIHGQSASEREVLSSTKSSKGITLQTSQQPLSDSITPEDAEELDRWISGEDNSDLSPEEEKEFNELLPNSNKPEATLDEKLAKMEKKAGDAVSASYQESHLERAILKRRNHKLEESAGQELAKLKVEVNSATNSQTPSSSPSLLGSGSASDINDSTSPSLVTTPDLGSHEPEETLADPSLSPSESPSPTLKTSQENFSLSPSGSPVNSASESPTSPLIDFADGSSRASESPSSTSSSSSSVETPIPTKQQRLIPQSPKASQKSKTDKQILLAIIQTEISPIFPEAIKAQNLFRYLTTSENIEICFEYLERTTPSTLTMTRLKEFVTALHNKNYEEAGFIYAHNLLYFQKLPDTESAKSFLKFILRPYLPSNSQTTKKESPSPRASESPSSTSDLQSTQQASQTTKKESPSSSASESPNSTSDLQSTQQASQTTKKESPSSSFWGGFTQAWQAATNLFWNSSPKATPADSTPQNTPKPTITPEKKEDDKDLGELDNSDTWVIVEDTAQEEDEIEKKSDTSRTDVKEYPNHHPLIRPQRSNYSLRQIFNNQRANSVQHFGNDAPPPVAEPPVAAKAPQTQPSVVQGPEWATIVAEENQQVKDLLPELINIKKMNGCYETLTTTTPQTPFLQNFKDLITCMYEIKNSNTSQENKEALQKKAQGIFLNEDFQRNLGLDKQDQNIYKFIARCIGLPRDYDKEMLKRQEK